MRSAANRGKQQVNRKTGRSTPVVRRAPVKGRSAPAEKLKAKAAKGKAPKRRAVVVKATVVKAKTVKAKALKVKKISKPPKMVSGKQGRKDAARSKRKESQAGLSHHLGAELKKKAFRSRATLNGCSRRKLIAFAEGRMALDEKLDILYHLDRCQKCWDDLYLIRKSKNGRLYSRKTRSYSEADIKAFEKESTPAEDEDTITETESAFDVA